MATMLFHYFSFNGTKDLSVYDFMQHEDEPELTIEQAMKSWT